MLDETAVASLQDILNTTRRDLGEAVEQLRTAESEVDGLKRKIAALEHSAARTAEAIEGVRLSMRAGSLGNTFHIDDDPQTPRIERAEPRSNIQDVTVHDFRRDGSVAYLNQNRPKLVQNDFEPKSDRFSDRTITQSCTLLLREAGRPLHVNELYNRLVEGGMKFKGNNPTISVAVSLSRNTRFCKVDPGTFDLVIREAYQVAS